MCPCSYIIALVCLSVISDLYNNMLFCTMFHSSSAGISMWNYLINMSSFLVILACRTYSVRDTRTVLNKETNTQTNTQINKQTNKEADIQAYRHTDEHLHTYIHTYKQTNENTLLKYTSYDYNNSTHF